MNLIATVHLLKPSTRLQRMVVDIYTAKFDHMSYDICNYRSTNHRPVIAKANTSCGVRTPPGFHLLTNSSVAWQGARGWGWGHILVPGTLFVVYDVRRSFYFLF